MLKDTPSYSGHRKRLRQKLLENGANVLADYELLELVLSIAIPRCDVKPLAKKLINTFESYGNVISAPIDQLSEVNGIGETAISTIKIIEESAIRLKKSRIKDRPALSSWNALLDYLMTSMGALREEQLRLIFLDKKNRIITDEVQQKGTVDHTPIYPREIIRRCLTLGATAFIIVHNHPSGDPKPSENDINMTKKVIKAADSMGIVVHDHIIIAGKKYISFKNQGYL